MTSVSSGWSASGVGPVVSIRDTDTVPPRVLRHQSRVEECCGPRGSEGPHFFSPLCLPGAAPVTLERKR